MRRLRRFFARVARLVRSHPLRALGAGLGVGVMGLAGVNVYVGSPTLPGSGVTCDLNATTANFSSQVSASSNGQTICLATGDYGTFNGTNKSITIRPQASATPTMTVSLGSGDSGFTLDGMSGMGGDVAAGVSDITIKNSDFTTPIVFDGPTNANFLLDHDTFDNQFRDIACHDTPARVHIAYGGATTGITINGSEFIGGDRDGIQAGSQVTITNNTFGDIFEDQGEADCQHSDPIQGFGAQHMTITGNLVYGSSDGIVAFDEPSDNHVITGNACYDLARPACVVLYTDTDSLVEHNTSGTGRAFEADKKTGDDAGTGTIVRNNVGSLSLSNTTLASNTHNLYSGASSPNINGSPTFVGGSSPTTYLGFRLAAGSAGENAATDGTDVGIP